MQIADAGRVPRAPRYRYPTAKTVRIAAAGAGFGTGERTADTEYDDEADATVQDISLTGMAVNSAARFSSGQMVELHMDGIPPLAGNVVRAYNDLVAVQFAKDEAARLRLEREVSRLNRVA